MEALRQELADLRGQQAAILPHHQPGDRVMEDMAGRLEAQEIFWRQQVKSLEQRLDGERQALEDRLASLTETLEAERTRRRKERRRLKSREKEKKANREQKRAMKEKDKDTFEDGKPHVAELRREKVGRHDVARESEAVMISEDQPAIQLKTKKRLEDRKDGGRAQVPHRISITYITERSYPYCTVLSISVSRSMLKC